MLAMEKKTSMKNNLHIIKISYCFKYNGINLKCLGY